MDVSAHGRVFSALGRCGPTLVVSTKAKSRVQIGKFLAQEKQETQLSLTNLRDGSVVLRSK